MDEVFKALADASRRQLPDTLNARNGQSLRELCAGPDMARQSASKHLPVLEVADVVTTVWRPGEVALSQMPLRSTPSPSAGSTSTTASGCARSPI
jgi:DNA-binding transcriptional ArsR family regulator